MHKKGDCLNMINKSTGRHQVALSCLCVLTYFGGAVDVLYWEDASKPVQQHLSQGRHQLCGGHQHIHTVRPETITTIHYIDLCEFVILK